MLGQILKKLLINLMLIFKYFFNKHNLTSQLCLINMDIFF